MWKNWKMNEELKNRSFPIGEGDGESGPNYLDGNHI